METKYALGLSTLGSTLIISALLIIVTVNLVWIGVIIFDQESGGKTQGSFLDQIRNESAQEMGSGYTIKPLETEATEEGFSTLSTALSPSNLSLGESFTLSVTAEGDQEIESISWESPNTFSNYSQFDSFSCDQQTTCSNTWEFITTQEGPNGLTVFVTQSSGLRSGGLHLEVPVQHYRAPTGPKCGNGVCESEESSANCTPDCGFPASICENSTCKVGESSTTARQIVQDDDGNTPSGGSTGNTGTQRTGSAGTQPVTTPTAQDIGTIVDENMLQTLVDSNTGIAIDVNETTIIPVSPIDPIENTLDTNTESPITVPPLPEEPLLLSNSIDSLPAINLSGGGGPYPFRFKGTNKIVQIGDAFFLIVPENDSQNGGQGRYLHKIYKAIPENGQLSWKLVSEISNATLSPSQIHCHADENKERCDFSTFWNFTGILMKDKENRLHIFSFAVFYMNPNNQSRNHRMVHLVSKLPVTENADEIEWELYAQSREIHSIYSIGVVNAVYDIARDGFHLVFAGGANEDIKDPIPNNLPLLQEKSNGLLTADPYHNTYYSTMLSYAFQHASTPYLEGKQILFTAVPVFYQSEADLLRSNSDKFIDYSGSEVMMYRHRKHPILTLRGSDELVLVTTGTMDGCRNLWNGEFCKRQLSPGITRNVLRPTGHAVVNVRYETYSINPNGTISELDAGIFHSGYRDKGNSVELGEDLRCKPSFEANDIVSDMLGNVFISTSRTSTATSATGCTEQVYRSVNLLSASNQLSEDIARKNYSRGHGLPCITNANNTIYWFVAAGNNEGVGEIYEIKEDSSWVSEEILLSNSNLPPGMINSYYPTCFNPKNYPEPISDLLIITTVADTSIGQEANPNVAGTSAVSVFAPDI